MRQMGRMYATNKLCKRLVEIFGLNTPIRLKFIDMDPTLQVILLIEMILDCNKCFCIVGEK